jgi:aspartate/methionine/tyrosine aminotransferase
MNTPNNPTGRVFDEDRAGRGGPHLRERDLVAITDEIYECIVYEGEHVRSRPSPGWRERTITVSGASKTFSVTGWRLGSVVAPASIKRGDPKGPRLPDRGCARAPPGGVGLRARGARPGVFRPLVERYRARRDLLVDGLRAAGFECRPPEGAYYILADFSRLSELDDTAFSLELSRSAGVTPVPGSSFFNGDAGRSLVRFAFCKRRETLEEGVERASCGTHGQGGTDDGLAARPGGPPGVPRSASGGRAR